MDPFDLLNPSNLLSPANPSNPVNPMNPIYHVDRSAKTTTGTVVVENAAKPDLTPFQAGVLLAMLLGGIAYAVLGAWYDDVKKRRKNR